MRVQLIGLGNVGKSLLGLIEEKRSALESLGKSPQIVSISDSGGTARDDNGLDPSNVLRHKRAGWNELDKYMRGYSALDAVRNIEADVAVELTPSYPSGEPGLSHIKTALECGKNVVTANKGPLAVAYKELTELAKRKRVHLLYEATVAAHLPVFCMIGSCFKADRLVQLEGILNGTTNFIIGEMEKGRDFQSALEQAINEGWAETNFSDDVDGIDAARKLVILANSFFKTGVRMERVRIEGIRNVGNMLKEAQKLRKRVKLICAVSWKGLDLEMSVAPQLIAKSDPFATVNGCDMALKLVLETSQQIFVSAQFTDVKQTAYAVLNDIIRIGSNDQAC